MDDKFRSEDVRFNSKTEPSDKPVIPKSKTLGDFSENIASVGKKTVPGAGINNSARVGKFQVHLPDEVNQIPDISYKEPVNKGPVLKNVTGKEYLESISRKPEANKASAVNQVQNKDSAPDKKRSKKKNLTPAQKKKLRARRRMNFINSVLVTCVCAIFIAILTVSASTIAMTTINDILVIDKSEKGDYVSVVIPAEVTEYDGVFDILKTSGLIKQPFITDLFCRFRHYDQVQRKNAEGVLETIRIKYEPGTYYLDKNMGIETMLEEIMVSRANSKDTVRLTFPEGWSVAQIFAKIEKYKVCEASKLYANLDIIGSQYGFIEKIADDGNRYLKAEGYLFPDTYDFYIGENASSVIKKLFNNFEVKWKDEYTSRAKKLGMSVDEIMTIASIIQREAKDSTQMAVISSVIHNRLKKSDAYPSIDMNSTKDYVLALKEYKVFSDFYFNLYLNSYNTYSNKGLPPGPICNPGAAAIKAALYPDKTDYYFFCHNDKGDIYLASTASQHQKNAEKVLYGN